MARVYNFSAGPAMLPVEVLKEAQEEMLDYVVEESVIEEAERRIRQYEQETAANALQLEQAQKEAAGKALVDIELLRQENEEKREYVKTAREGVNTIR